MGALVYRTGTWDWLALFRADRQAAGHSREESPPSVPPLPVSRLLPPAGSVPDSTDWQTQYAEVVDLAWRTLRRLGVADSSLADAVQDTLLVLHRRRAEFRQESNVRTWVYGIVLRVASGYRRSARRAGSVFDGRQPLAVETAASLAPSPFEQLEQRAATELLHQLLDELPAEVRAPFVLVELEELSLEAAADALGLRASTCRSRLRTARRAFDEATGRERARLARLK
ncbi:MAG: sigma-70 family RNA polymerase sigma factor [Deltaproteobacteria bacterium]